MSIFKLAWRNVWRNKRRSVVTIAAMTLALWVMVLYSGLITGYLAGMQRNLLDLELGDIQIFGGDYLDRPSLYTAIADPGGLLERLDREGLPASARLLAGGLAAAGEFSAGVSLRGVDVQRDASVTGVATAVAEGSWLEEKDPRGVVIGRRLAKTLAVRPGDELVVLSQAADGSLANDLFTVRGVLKGISDGTDRSAVFLTQGAFRELMVYPRGAHQIIVRKPAGLDLGTAAGVVRRQAGDHAADLDVKTWRELMPTVALMFDSAKDMVSVIVVVVYLAIGILILNAMLMAVFERIREFGVFKALGVGPVNVFRLIVTESLVQTGIALLAGLTLAVPGMWYLAEHGIDTGKMGGMSVMGLAVDPVWYGVYRPDTVVRPVIMLVLIVLLAVLYPALKAAWIRPVQAMHHQ